MKDRAMKRSAWLWMAMGLVAAVCLTGCGPQYVNIPRQAGDVASGDPNATNVRNIQVQALQRVLSDHPLDPPIMLTLPEGSDPLTYAAVASAVDESIRTPLDEDVEPASTLEVNQIRIRGTRAEVDVVRPRGEQGRQFITVYLTRTPTSPWSVDRVRAWQGQVQQ